MAYRIMPESKGYGERALKEAIDALLAFALEPSRANRQEFMSAMRSGGRTYGFFQKFDEKLMERNPAISGAWSRFKGKNPPDLSGFLDYLQAHKFSVTIPKRVERKAEKRREHVQNLIDAMGDSDPAVRRHASNELIELRDPRSIPALLRGARDNDKTVRENSAFALEEIGKPVLHHLAGRLGDRDPDERLSALEWISRFEPDAEIARAIVPSLNDKSENVRDKAKQVLEKMGSMAFTALTAGLRHREWHIRMLSASVLAETGDFRVVPALIKALSDKDWGVRSEAARALGHIGDERAIPELRRVSLSDEDLVVKSAAEGAIAKITNAVQNK